MTDFAPIRRWLTQMQTAHSEFGVPIDRLAGHMVIESSGDPKAVQRNPTNGDSFGLFQVVPRWWKTEIERLAGRTYSTFEAVGAALMNDPLLATRAGAFVLKTFFDKYGNWDRASSSFFVGNPNWQGGDYVNGTTAGQYRQRLNSLIAEWNTSEQPEPATNPGQAIADAALSVVGSPYVWGTAGPTTFDCSGLTAWSVKQATGQTISRDSHGQFNIRDAVERDTLQPGDILLFDTQGGREVREGNRCSHVGILTSVNPYRMVNALNPERGVVVSDPFSGYFAPLYLGARRIVQDAEVPVSPNPFPKPVLYDLARDHARWGITASQAAVILSHRFTARDGGAVKAVVIHIQDGYTRGSLEHWTGVQASSSVMIQKDGSLLRVIPDADGPWTNGDAKNPTARGKQLQGIAGGLNLNCVSATIENEALDGEMLTAPQLAANLWMVTEWFNRHGLTVQDIYRHADINTVDKRNCPGDGVFNQIITALKAKDAPPIKPTPEAPVSPYPKPIPNPKPWDGDDFEKDGVPFVAWKRTWRAARDNVKAHQFAHETAPAVRAPLKKGDAVNGAYVVQSGHEMWVVSDFGTRFRCADLEPAFPFPAAS